MKVYKIIGYYESNYEREELPCILFKTEMSAQKYIIRLAELSKKLLEFYRYRWNKFYEDRPKDKWCLDDDYYDNVELRVGRWGIKGLDYIEVTVRD